MLLFFGDLLAMLLLFFYIFVFHLLSFGSFMLDSSQDERIAWNLTEWIQPTIFVGTLTYIYIKYLKGKEKYKKVKIYTLIMGFSISFVFNVIWILLHFDNENSNYLYVQLSVLGVTLLLIFYADSVRKKLLSKEGV
ncbi:hypothetical protein [Cytobacillus luteolus]|uniref:hypothetical protein n=1 Tax=Litchfieldia luteola TaxID=682179 RepID=UPI001CAD42F0|nr:hypothetical protein [Cytobacillus luteolus]MBP1942579.1 hypothetical protein [Cytobacillus luteolus]